MNIYKINTSSNLLDKILDTKILKQTNDDEITIEDSKSYSDKLYIDEYKFLSDRISNLLIDMQLDLCAGRNELLFRRLIIHYLGTFLDRCNTQDGFDKMCRYIKNNYKISTLSKSELFNFCKIEHKKDHYLITQLIQEVGTIGSNPIIGKSLRSVINHMHMCEYNTHYNILQNQSLKTSIKLITNVLMSPKPSYIKTSMDDLSNEKKIIYRNLEEEV